MRSEKKKTLVCGRGLMVISDRVFSLLKLGVIRLQAPRVSWDKCIWFKEATPKFSFLTWLAVHNRLSTGDRLLRWNPQAISTCWLCKSATETRDNLFFQCSYSEEVWRGTVRGLASGFPVQWTTLLQRLVTCLQDKTRTFLLCYCFQAVVYAI